MGFYHETIKMRGKGKNKEGRYSLTTQLMCCLGEQILLFSLSLHYVINFSVYFLCKGHPVGLVIQGKYFFPHNKKTWFFQQNTRPVLENLLSRDQVVKIIHVLSEKQLEWLDC